MTYRSDALAAEARQLAIEADKRAESKKPAEPTVKEQIRELVQAVLAIPVEQWRKLYETWQSGSVELQDRGSLGWFIRVTDGRPVEVQCGWLLGRKIAKLVAGLERRAHNAAEAESAKELLRLAKLDASK